MANPPANQLKEFGEGKVAIIQPPENDIFGDVEATLLAFSKYNVNLSRLSAFITKVKGIAIQKNQKKQIPGNRLLAITKTFEVLDALNIDDPVNPAVTSRDRLEYFAHLLDPNLVVGDVVPVPATPLDFNGWLGAYPQHRVSIDDSPDLMAVNNRYTKGGLSLLLLLTYCFGAVNSVRQKNLSSKALSDGIDSLLSGTKMVGYSVPGALAMSSMGKKFDAAAADQNIIAGSLMATIVNVLSLMHSTSANFKIFENNFHSYAESYCADNVKFGQSKLKKNLTLLASKNLLKADTLARAKSALAGNLVGFPSMQKFGLYEEDLDHCESVMSFRSDANKFRSARGESQVKDLLQSVKALNTRSRAA